MRYVNESYELKVETNNSCLESVVNIAFVVVINLLCVSIHTASVNIIAYITVLTLTTKAQATPSGYGFG